MNILRLYDRLTPLFRRRRMRLFARYFPGSELRVLDLGGTRINWQFLDRPPRVYVTNILPTEPRYRHGVCFVFADARQLPFRNGEFDVVFSNSVIEHVGSFDSQRRFAAECQRVGQSYFVQTPDRRFPLEPHLLTPFIHWLPRSLQRRLLRNFTVRGLLTRPTQDWCDQFLERVRLLGRREMSELFPDGEVLTERFLGLSKSLIAIRRHDGSPGS